MNTGTITAGIGTITEESVITRIGVSGVLAHTSYTGIIGADVRIVTISINKAIYTGISSFVTQLGRAGITTLCTLVLYFITCFHSCAEKPVIRAGISRMRAASSTAGIGTVAVNAVITGIGVIGVLAYITYTGIIGADVSIITIPGSYTGTRKGKIISENK